MSNAHHQLIIHVIIYRHVSAQNLCPVLQIRTYHFCFTNKSICSQRRAGVLVSKPTFKKWFLDLTSLLTTLCTRHAKFCIYKKRIETQNRGLRTETSTLSSTINPWLREVHYFVFGIRSMCAGSWIKAYHLVNRRDTFAVTNVRKNFRRQLHVQWNRVTVAHRCSKAMFGRRD